MTGPHVERSRAIVLSDDHADLLRCRNGAPRLAVRWRDFAQSGVAVEFTGSRYRADAFDFVAERHVGAR